MRVRFDTVDVLKGQRRAEYMEGAGRTLEAQRIQRRSVLSERAESIRRATSAYESLDDGNLAQVGVRTDFVRLAKARGFGAEMHDRSGLGTVWGRDWATRPPCTRLIHRQANALPFYMTAIYIAHLEAAPGTLPPNEHRIATGGSQDPSWARLAGLHDTNRRVRRARVVRALLTLQEYGLVELDTHGGTRSFEQFSLLAEDAREQRYKVPSEKPGRIIRLPSLFFNRGWHLVLHPKETALLLVLLDVTQHAPGTDPTHGVALPERVRWERYGISGEVYESHHELQEFGLLRLIDPMPQRRRGKIRAVTRSPNDEQSFAPIPYRFVVRDDVFDRPAYDVISNCLSQYTKPPRFYD